MICSTEFRRESYCVRFVIDLANVCFAELLLFPVRKSYLAYSLGRDPDYVLLILDEWCLYKYDFYFMVITMVL